jgi:hypothetical protein
VLRRSRKAICREAPCERQENLTLRGRLIPFAALLPKGMKSYRTIQGGFHELQNEPDGVKEKFTDECAAWAEEHFPSVAEGANQSQAKL